MIDPKDKFYVDGNQLEETIVHSQCGDCAHFYADGICDAFPDAIPVKLVLNQHDHRHPYPGDNGIRWQPRTPADKHPLDQA